MKRSDEVLGSDGAPVEGIELGELTLEIGAVPVDDVISRAFVQGEHWLDGGLS